LLANAARSWAIVGIFTKLMLSPVTAFTNGLLRQHLLKQRVFDNLSQKQVNKALALLSNILKLLLFF
jgi:hypothetical protein